MARRSLSLLVVAGALASLGASYRSPRFAVQAPTETLAREVARLAERHCKSLARSWLGKELPAWSEPCPLTVEPGAAPLGTTTLSYYDDQVVKQKVLLRGPLDHVLRSILPHELTHLVFAHHFRAPVPRWADEGGAMLAEDERERRAWERLVPEVLDVRGHGLPLRRFLPGGHEGDVRAFYAQSYSLTRFLIDWGDRTTFLAFIGTGLRDDWDRAARTHYRCRNVDELELAWVRWRHLPPRARTALVRLHRLEDQLARHESAGAGLSAAARPAWQRLHDHYRREVEQARRALEQIGSAGPIAAPPFRR